MPQRPSFVAVAERLEEPPVEILVDAEMRHAARTDDRHAGGRVPVADRASDHRPEVEAAPRGGLVRRVERVGDHRQSRYRAVAHDPAQDEAEGVRRAHMTMVRMLQPLVRRGEVEPLLHRARENEFGQVGKARIDGVTRRPVRPLGIRDPGRQLGLLRRAGRPVVEGLAAIDGEGGLDVFEEQLALVVAEDHAGIRRDFLPRVGQRLDTRLAGVVAPLPLVVGDPRRDVLARPPLDQLVEGEALRP